VNSFAARARRFAGSSAGLIVLVTVGLAVPLLVAVIALTQRRWYPVLDLAMTEFRIRDVGSRQTPLIGLPGRIGEFPDQGSHPGPINFWLLAPGYRLFGSSAWAMEASTAVLQTLWIGLALWIGHRRAGRTGVIVVALVVALLIRGYGLSVLTQPWNPYLPLIAWVVILLATWSVVSGDHAMLIPLAVAASFAAQTHIPYLVMAGGLGAGAAVLVTVRWIRERRSGEVEGLPRVLLITAAVFAMLSLPMLADQVRRTPGNITRLLDHFGNPPEEAIGFVRGFELLLQHLNVFRAVGTMFTGTGGLVDLGQLDGATWIPGALVLSMWVAAVIGARELAGRALAARTDVQALLHLHLVTGAVLVLSWFSMSRIFGTTWFYLTLWAWAIMLLVVVATVWTAVLWFNATDIATGHRALVAVTGAIALCTAATSVAAVGTDHPEEYLGETLGAVVEATADALDPDGTYVVFWTDAHSFGSQGFGLVNELERQGFDVGVYEAWRVPVTGQRVLTANEADTEIIWATGSFVDVWRADDRVTEIAAVEPRTPAELEEFAMLRTELIADLIATGLDDLVPLVDNNLFGVRIDGRISSAALEASKRLLDLDQNAAVFIGPSGVSQ
jgi:hypothetical protein